MKFDLKSKNRKSNSKNFKVLLKKYFHCSNQKNLTLYNNTLQQLNKMNKKTTFFIFNCFFLKRKNKSLTARRFLSNFDKKVNKIFLKKINQNLALTSSEKIWLNFVKIKKQQFSNSFLKLLDNYQRFDRWFFERKTLGQIQKIISLNSSKNSVLSELSVPINFIRTSFSSFKLLNIFCLIEFFSIQNQKKIYYNKLFFFKMNFFKIQKKSLDNWSNFYYICITFWSSNLLVLLTNRIKNSQFTQITIRFSYILFKIRQLLKKFLLQYVLVPTLETKFIVNDCFYMLGQSIYDCLEYIYQNLQQYQKFVLKINNLINTFSLNIFQYSINSFSLNDLTDQFRKKKFFLNHSLFIFNTENFFSKILKFQYLSFDENINMKIKNESLQKNTSFFFKMKKQKKKNRTNSITSILNPTNKKTKLNSIFNKTFFYDVTFVHFFQLKYIQKMILWFFLKNCSKNSIRWSQFLPSSLPFAKPLSPAIKIDKYPYHRRIWQSGIYITNKKIPFSLFRNKTQKPLKYNIVSFLKKKTNNFENKTQNGKKKKVSKKWCKKRFNIKCCCFVYNPLKFESKHFLLSRKIKLRNEISLFFSRETNKGIKFFGTESSKGQTKNLFILKENHFKIQNGLFNISKIQCENIFLSISPNYEILLKFFNSICYWLQKYGIFCSFFTLKNSISGFDLAGFYLTQKKKINKKIPFFLEIPESFYQTFFSDLLSFRTFSSKEFHSCFLFFLKRKKRSNKVYVLFKQFLTDYIKNLFDQKKQLDINSLIEKKKFSQFLPLFFQNKGLFKNKKEIKN